MDCPAQGPPFTYRHRIEQQSCSTVQSRPTHEAHPKHARAERWTGGATEKLVVGHSNHGGEADVDGGVPVTAVDEMIKQQGTKHHGNMEKMEQRFARTEAYRRALSTVKRDHR